MRITVSDDFDLYKIAYSGQCFRVRVMEDSESREATYRFITRDNVVDIFAVSKLSSESSDSPQTVLEISCDEEQWNRIWVPYFDLHTDYRKIRQSIPSSDKYLTRSADIGRGIRILNQDRFETLISFIISQRKSIPAIKSSVEKLSKLYGHKICAPTGEGIYTFPTPKELSCATESELTSCGLGYRVPYILETVEKVLNSVDSFSLDEISKLTDDALLNALKSLKGVGNKVANCVSLFAYHRLGLAPVDTWISKVIDEQYNGINPFINYPEYGGVMQQYIFYYAQHASRKQVNL